MYQPLSHIHPGARIAKNVVIEPFSSIESNVVIGKGTWIGSNVTIMSGARIGKNCSIFPGSSNISNLYSLSFILSIFVILTKLAINIKWEI